MKKIAKKVGRKSAARGSTRQAVQTKSQAQAKVQKGPVARKAASSARAGVVRFLEAVQARRPKASTSRPARSARNIKARSKAA